VCALVASRLRGDRRESGGHAAPRDRHDVSRAKFDAGDEVLADLVNTERKSTGCARGSVSAIWINGPPRVRPARPAS
jgi:hypothetical protein